MSERPLAARFTETVSRSRTTTVAALRRRDAGLVFAGTTVGYLLLYLYAIGHLAPGLGGVGVTVVDDPLGAFLRPALGPLSFTPVASVRLGPVTYVFSFDTVLGLGLSALVGVNFAVTYLAWTQPKACGIGRSSTGVLASLPAVLSGTACCAPVVVIALGIQLSGVLLTAFQYLLPVAAALLVGSLLLVGRQVDPDLV